MFPLFPANTPPDCEKPEEEVVIFIPVFEIIVPAYAAVMIKPVMDALTSIEQLPVNPPSKITTSPTPGTARHGIPPEVFAQLRPLFQLPVDPI